MPNLKFEYSRHICLVHASPLGGEPSRCDLTYLNKPTRGDIEGDYKINKESSPFSKIISPFSQFIQ